MDGVYRGGYLDLLVERKTGLNFSWKRGFDMLRCLLRALAPPSLALKKKKPSPAAADNCYKHLPKATAESAASARQCQTSPRGVWDSVGFSTQAGKNKKGRGEGELCTSTAPQCRRFAGWKQPVSTCGQPRWQTASPPAALHPRGDWPCPRSAQRRGPLSRLPAGFSLSPVFFLRGGCWESESPDYNLYESHS